MSFISYATSRSELIEGAVAVAVPFFDRTGLVAGSIGVYGPEVRLGAARQQQIARLLLDESVKLSEALGFGGSAA
jgi:DNA-binding IclR family transcriptional regulator